MGRSIPPEPDVITIPSGQTVSGEVGGFATCSAIGITGPGTLSGTVITVEVSPFQTGSVWATLRSGSNNVEMVAAGQHISLMELTFQRLRVKSNVAEGAARDFYVVKHQEP